MYPKYNSILNWKSRNFKFLDTLISFSLIGPLANNFWQSNGKRSLDRISVDRNCVLSLDQNYVYHLTEFCDTFHLIELFDQLIKKNWRILAVDQNFKKPKIPVLELLINCQKKVMDFGSWSKLFKLI